MKDNMYLIGVDELGDEVVVASYRLTLDLDEDEVEIWQDRKIREARETMNPEWQYFYFEDRRSGRFAGYDPDGNARFW